MNKLELKWVSLEGNKKEMQARKSKMMNKSTKCSWLKKWDQNFGTSPTNEALLVSEVNFGGNFLFTINTNIRPSSPLHYGNKYTTWVGYIEAFQVWSNSSTTSAYQIKFLEFLSIVKKFSFGLLLLRTYHHPLEYVSEKNYRTHLFLL